jgi:hypothetical protein
MKSINKKKILTISLATVAAFVGAVFLAQQMVIIQAKNYEWPNDTICGTALTPATHTLTRAKYTFSSTCIPPGWEAISKQVNSYEECINTRGAIIKDEEPRACAYKGQTFAGLGDVASQNDENGEFVAMSNFEGASERFTNFAKSVTGQTTGDNPCLTMSFQKESGAFALVNEGQGVLGQDTDGNPICEIGGGGAAVIYKLDGSVYVKLIAYQDTPLCNDESIPNIPNELLAQCITVDGQMIDR